MKNQPLKDLLTGEDFIPQRINQKFATPANRIKYYNDKANEQRHKLAYVNKPLQKNWRISIELLEGKEEAVFHKQFMIGKGFKFGVCTHYQNHLGKTYAAIYNFIFLTLPDEQIKIKRT